MKKLFVLLMLLSIFVGSAAAESLKVKVSEFSVTGAANKDELKSALPALLSSRLSGEGIAIVDSSADLQLLGSYTAFGSTFSIDAVLKDSSGATAGRSFVQGKGADDLIPALGKLAGQLSTVIKGIAPKPAAVAAAAPKAAVLMPAAVPVAVATAPVPVATRGDVVAVQGGDVVRNAPAGGQVSRQTRIEGLMRGIAPVKTLANGVREFVLASENRVYLYRKGESLEKIAEYQIKGGGQILAVDTADADGDGVLEAYLTIMDREELKSLALAIGESGFTTIAERLRYYFRAQSVSGGAVQLFGQEIGKEKEDFYGAVRRVVKNGSKYTLGEAVKLPAYANIFSFNRFKSADGAMYTVVIDGDGNLRIIDETGKELWKGSERFGGSEVYFLRDEQQMQPISDSRYRWRFIEQRIVVAPNGEIIVPRNSGMFVLGNNRSYSKNSIFAFSWNGASIDERWHTRESQNYLADYYYDTERKELVLLEQVQKSGFLNKGASAVSIKKVD